MADERAPRRRRATAARGGPRARSGTPRSPTSRRPGCRSDSSSLGDVADVERLEVLDSQTPDEGREDRRARVALAIAGVREAGVRDSPVGPDLQVERQLLAGPPSLDLAPCRGVGHGPLVARIAEVLEDDARDQGSGVLQGASILGGSGGRGQFLRGLFPLVAASWSCHSRVGNERRAIVSEPVGWQRPAPGASAAPVGSTRTIISSSWVIFRSSRPRAPDPSRRSRAP